MFGVVAIVVHVPDVRRHRAAASPGPPDSLPLRIGGKSCSRVGSRVVTAERAVPVVRLSASSSAHAGAAHAMTTASN